MKILIPTVSRSDFGILTLLIKNLRKEKKFKVNTLVTGEHFSKKMGHTYKEVIRKKIKINFNFKLSEYNSNSNSILKKSSQIILKVSNLLSRDRPDLLIVLGDKYETLIISYCAFIHRIPIFHIHGGEKTAGSLDDTFRHQISKMSNLHFVERKIYKKRLMQLGENSNEIIIAGSLARETIKKNNFYSRKYIEKKFNFKFFDKNVIFTFHPEIGEKLNKKRLNEIFSVIEKNPNIKFIITSPNLDDGSDMIRSLILKKIYYKNVSYVKSFGQDYFFSVLKIVDGVIGNSSSGLIEAPALRKFSINIGNRQNGRFVEKSVINCKNKVSDIQRSIRLAYSKNFKKKLSKFKQSKELETSKIIIKSIKRFNFKKHRYKEFNDINF